MITSLYIWENVPGRLSSVTYKAEMDSISKFCRPCWCLHLLSSGFNVLILTLLQPRHYFGFIVVESFICSFHQIICWIPGSSPCIFLASPYLYLTISDYQHPVQKLLSMSLALGKANWNFKDFWTWLWIFYTFTIIFIRLIQISHGTNILLKKCKWLCKL